MVKLSDKKAIDTKNSTYTNRTTVGHQNHDLTFKKLPMYSFPKGEKVETKDTGPGPAAYPQIDKDLKKNDWKSLYPNDKSFQYSLGSRRCFENRPINPGPAAYPILSGNKKKYFNEKLPINGLTMPKKANQFSFGLARKPFKLSIQTEPALYPSIGRSISLKDEKNQFTFAGRPVPPKSKFITPAPNAYPFLEREKANSIYPNETKLKPTMRARNKDVFKSNSPPPNTYPRDSVNRGNSQDIMKKMTSGPSAPAYTMRRRLY